MGNISHKCRTRFLGTTLFILPNAAYAALYNSFNALCSKISLKVHTHIHRQTRILRLFFCRVSAVFRYPQSIFANGGASTCAQMSQSDIDAFPKISVLLVFLFHRSLAVTLLDI